MQRDDARLFDLYPERDRMALWFITARGRRLRLSAPFSPLFYIEGVESGLSASDRRRLDRTLAASPAFEPAGFAVRRDFWTGQARRVFRVRVVDLERCAREVAALSDAFPALVFYDCDIAPEILYGCDTGLFPTARCEIEHAGGELRGFALNDDPLDPDFELPPLTEVELSAEGDLIGRRLRLRSIALRHGGETSVWDEGPPEAALDALRRRLELIDPDVIWTSGGDGGLMRTLFATAQGLNVATGLDRDAGAARRLDGGGRTCMSYGRVLYHAPDYPLFGRWHLDRRHSFWAGAGRLEGLAEVARMTRMPVQRAARRSIGTGMASIQLAWARGNGFLIPWKKARPEDWKSAWQLMRADRGGLTFQPLTGVYEDVWELDFVSMYPSIMARRNVSPETVNCPCCAPSADVPELGYAICRKRRGMTAQTLQPIIDKRAAYKARREAARAAGDEPAAGKYDDRQEALKWLLVCCFGYLGYRNARFGRIEAHEATCAYSRQTLLRAKALCEERGFEALHLIVDCVWIRKPGAGRDEIEALRREIERATGLDLAVEGRYAWIAFLPSRQNPDLPVPNRYFGAMENGEVKFRGIEARRSDQAPFVRWFQANLLGEFARGAANLAECRDLSGEALGLLDEAEGAIARREVPADELLLRRKTSRAAGDYRSNAMTAVAARQAARAGLDLHAGQAVEFLVVDQKNVDPDSRIRLAPLLRPEDGYDVEFYREQLRRAAATVLEPLLGEALESLAGKEMQAPEPRQACEQPDLFEPWAAG